MNERSVRLTSIKPTSVALFMGAIGAVLGVAVAIMAWLSGTVHYTQATNSLLQGLLLGLSAGFLALIALPIIYFAVGWLVGVVYGMVMDMALRAMGGLEVGTRLESEEYQAAAPTVQSPATKTPATPATSRRAQPTFGERIDTSRR